MKPATQARLIKKQRDQLITHMKTHYVARLVACDDDFMYLFDDVGCQVESSELFQRALTNTSLPWRIYGYVFCRDQTGEEYFRIMETKTPPPCKREQLMEGFADKLFRFATNEVNPLHFLTVGYVATCSPDVPDDATIDKIFTSLGAYSQFKTRYEGSKE